MADYKCVTDLSGIIEYIGDANVAAMDIETSPVEHYRNEPKAALDAHKSRIAGISFSIAPDTGIYVPLTHRIGQNADTTAIMPWIRFTKKL